MLYNDSRPPPSTATTSEPGRATTTRRSTDDSFAPSQAHDWRHGAVSERRPTPSDRIVEKPLRSLSWRTPVEHTVLEQSPIDEQPQVAI